MSCATATYRAQVEICGGKEALDLTLCAEAYAQTIGRAES